MNDHFRSTMKMVPDPVQDVLTRQGFSAMDSEALAGAGELLGEIMRGEVNPEDEAEKLVLAYGENAKE